ncbi:MAG TPA: phosphopantetheine-binding protein [Planctomycetota bacterium]|nr:phosphopantetheine-binding protein [Planctomycetota bacterium]
MDEKEIVSKVCKCVATALGRDEDEVQVEKRLQSDLEAESIDYLDITFQLEKAFGISIDKDELFPQKIFQDEELVRNGVVTEKGLRFLEEKLPYADLGEFKKDPRVTRVPDLFTVGLLVNYVKTKLAAS